MVNPQSCSVTIHRLEGIGGSTIIDDFGTGFSSLRYLGTLPTKCLKIDKVFVSGVQHHVENQAIVKLILSMAGEENVCHQIKYNNPQHVTQLQGNGLK
ncbi:MAG: EAL domain-containing protein [Pseudomonadales bacterium]|nr:EAL domain-containing protein [Pseudomonadales bacterium]